MKLVVNASVTTNVDPIVTRFFYVTTALISTSVTVNTTDFFQDDGSAATELPVLATENSYYNVFMNGVLQMSDISTYTPGATGVGSLVITVPVGEDPILAGTPIVLEVINYNPTTNTTITT